MEKDQGSDEDSEDDSKKQIILTNTVDGTGKINFENKLTGEVIEILAKTDEKTGELELPSERAKHYFLKAKYLLKNGGGSSLILEKVLVYAMKVIAFMPNESKYYIFLSKVYLTALDFTSAIYCLRYLIKLQPRNASARKKLSEILVIKGQEIMVDAQRNGNDPNYFLRAMRSFDESLTYDRENLVIWVFKALCHVHLNEIVLAYECVKKRLSSGNPTFYPLELYILKAKLLWAQGLITDGNKDFRVAATCLPLHPEVEAFSAGNFIKAESLYHSSVDSFHAKKYPDALKYCKHALTITADDIKLHIMLSKIYRLMDDLDAAFKAIQQATLICESSSDFTMSMPDDILIQTNLVYNELALRFASKGEYDQAIALFTKVLTTEQNLSRGLVEVDYRFYLNRGDCYRALDKIQLALDDYNSALVMSPLDWQIRTRKSLIHYMRASSAFNIGSYSEAEENLNDAIENNPKVSEYYMIRGKARYFLGKFQGAYSDFASALEYNPDCSEAKLRIKQFEIGDESSDNIKQDTMLDASIEMMLHPHRARYLPDLNNKNHHAKGFSSTSNAGRNISEPSTRLTHSKFEVGKKAILLLPQLNPKMVVPILASNELDARSKQFSTIMGKRPGNVKDEIWGLVKNATALAAKRRIPLHGEKKRSSVNKPCTAVGLKKASMEATKKALKKGGLVVGVTTTYDDPFLLSLEKGSKVLNVKYKKGGKGLNGQDEESRFQEEAVEKEKSQVDEDLLSKVFKGYKRKKKKGGKIEENDYDSEQEREMRRIAKERRKYLRRMNNMTPEEQENSAEYQEYIRDKIERRRNDKNYETDEDFSDSDSDDEKGVSNFVKFLRKQGHKSEWEMNVDGHANDDNSMLLLTEEEELENMRLMLEQEQFEAKKKEMDEARAEQQYRDRMAKQKSSLKNIDINKV
jgi:tetratricopeptide (TPR) repeat protein